MEHGTGNITCELARDFDLVDYLAGLGLKPSRIRGYDFWYRSPFREERTPSFKINRKLNRWYDFGEGCGGNLIDFAVRYHGCTVSELLRSLSGSSFALQIPHRESRADSKSRNPGITIHKTGPLSSYPLLRYLEERRIPIAIASRYCSELDYTIGRRNYYGIGFKNDSGGWELRNPYFKGGVSPKGTTSFIGGNSILCVMEGFMDFLSFQTLVSNADSRYDFLVLNGLAFFEKSRVFMEAYREIWLLLDRDAAGTDKTRYACSLLPNYLDKSDSYRNHKDLNEWLCSPGNNTLELVIPKQPP